MDAKAAYAAEKELRSTVATLEAPVQSLRTLVRGVDRRTTELLDEWMNETKDESRYNVNPLHRIKKLLFFWVRLVTRIGHDDKKKRPPN